MNLLIIWILDKVIYNNNGVWREHRKGGFLRGFVRNTFLTLITVFLVYISFNQAYHLGFLHVHYVIQIIIYVMAIVLIIWIVKKLINWMTSFRVKFSVELIISLLLILFFAHELFTPYFYTEDYLMQAGLEKIEIYQQLSNPEIHGDERAELAEESVAKGLAEAYSLTGFHPPSLGPLDQIEIQDMKRSFYQYHLVIEGKYRKQESANTFRFTFQKDGLDFKITGFSARQQ